MKHHFLPFLTILLYACPLKAQVKITEEWFDNKRLTLEITLENTSDSSLYLTSVYNTCIEYHWNAVHPSPGDGKPINTKSAARYLFHFPEKVTSDEYGNRMAKNSTESFTVMPVELPKHRHIKIEFGYDFLDSDFDNVTYTGFAGFRFDEGLVLQSKTFSFGDKQADQNSALTQSQLVEKINQDTTGNFSYVYHMLAFPWDKQDATALIAKYMNDPQPSNAILIKGLNKEEVLATTMSKLGLDTFSWYIREKFLARPSAALLKAYDFKNGPRQSDLLGEFLQRYVEDSDSARPAYGDFFADYFLKTRYPDNCKRYQSALNQIFEQYASAEAPAHLNTGALNAIGYALLRTQTGVRSGYAPPLSKKVGPWIKRTLENSPDTDKEKLLDQIIRNLQESRGELEESTGYLKDIGNTIYTLILRSKSPAIRVKSLKISQYISSLSPKMDTLAQIALNDADQNMRTTAAEIVRDQQLGALAPQLLHNMARYDTAEGIWVYWNALKALGMQNTKEGPDLLVQCLDNIKIKSNDNFFYALTELNKSIVIQPVRSWFMAHIQWASSSGPDTIQRVVEVARTLCRFQDTVTLGAIGSLIRQKSNSLFIEKYFAKLSSEYFLYAKGQDAFAYLRQLQPDIYPYFLDKNLWQPASLKTGNSPPPPFGQDKGADFREDVLTLMCVANENRTQLIQILQTGLTDSANKVVERAAYFIGELGIRELKEDLKTAYQKNKNRYIREALEKLGEKTD